MPTINQELASKEHLSSIEKTFIQLGVREQLDATIQQHIPIAIEDYVKNFLDIERDISYKDGYEISATHRK
jgi:hypothetical protein